MKREYGVLMPVFSLPSRYGIGDFGQAAYNFVDLLAKHGVKNWQILPLNPGNPENGESPYFSISAFAINPLLISLEKLKYAGLLLEKEIDELPQFPQHTIDYDLLRSTKMSLLEKAVTRFRKNQVLDQFCQSNRHWLDDFALFDVLHNDKCLVWNEWPVAFRERDSRTITEYCKLRHKEIHIRKVIQFFAYIQWQALHLYCTDNNVSIIGDMPIYVALDSADTWSNPELFKLDDQRKPVAVSGVPPDYFSTTGQLWNNPVYDWDAHNKDNYSWWIRRLTHLFTLYDVVRIDHFRGLVKYWEIPAGEKTAINGEWKDVPTYSFFDTLCKAFKSFPVICEDLGIITDDVRAAIQYYGFSGMKVLQFAFGDDDPENPYLPHNYDRNCLVYTGTHDNLPTLGWLSTITDGKDRSGITRYTGKSSNDKQTVWDLIGLAMMSIASIAVVPLQDILTLGDDARINDPAKLHGNWRWRWDPARDPAQLAFGQLLELGKLSGRVGGKVAGL